MTYTYRTKGTCSKSITLEIDDLGIIRDIHITEGCPGNLRGLELLVKGQDARKVSELLAGVRCGRKSTSCPDQLAKAIQLALAQGEETQG